MKGCRFGVFYWLRPEDVATSHVHTAHPGSYCDPDLPRAGGV